MTELFGATAFATSATLGGFMAGLGVGGYLGARLVARSRSPLRLYGVLELALVPAVASVPLLLNAADALFTSAYAAGLSTAGLNAMRAALSLAVLLVPTTLMGATLPALAQAVVRTPRAIGRPLGVLYMCNTLGAALGALLTGFVLLEHLGVRLTTIAAMAANAAIGAVALLASRRLGQVGARPDLSATRGEPSPAAARRHAVVVGYAVSGLAALALEVVWSRALVLYAGSTTYAFTTMVVVMLVGLGCGSLVGSRIADALSQPIRALALVLAATAVAAVVCFVSIRWIAPPLEAWLVPEPSFGRLILVTTAIAAAAILVPATGFGAVFPLVGRVQARGAGSVGVAIGHAYAANLLGSVAGALAGGFVLIPLLGVYGTLRAIASALCVTAAALWFIDARGGMRRAALGSLALAAVGVLPYLLPARHVHYQPAAGESLVYYAEGASATVSVVRDQTGAKTLFVDRMSVAGTDPVMQTDQKSLAHIPMLLHPDPKRILTVGFGSGGASWSYTRYPSLEQADCVEIAPEVVGAAPHLREANHDLFDDPRYRIISDDARAYLRHTPERYDIIATDCTDLRYKGNASLYTKEYFGLCRLRLRPKGLVVVWMPLGGLSEDLFKMALRTFADAMPHVSVWYMNNYPTHYVLLVGSEEPHGIRWEAMLERLQHAGVREDLASIHLDNPLRLASTFLIGDAAVRDYVRGAEVNSDERPLLEFRAPRVTALFSGAEILRTLVNAAGGADAIPLQVSHGDAQRRTVLSRLQPYVAAARLVNLGHVSYQQGARDFAAAIGYYQAASRTNPADPYLPLLVQATERTRDATLEVYRIAAEQPDASPGALHNYGLTLLAANRPAEAVVFFRRLAGIRGDLFEAHLNLARAARLAGHTAEAGSAAERAVQLAPRRADAHFELALQREAAGEPAGALDAYRAAAALDPRLAEAFFNQGTVLVALNRLREAEAAYRAGLARQPESAAARVNLAQVLLLLGDAEAARAELQRAATDPGAPGRAALELMGQMARE